MKDARLLQIGSARITSHAKLNLGGSYSRFVLTAWLFCTTLVFDAVCLDTTRSHLTLFYINTIKYIRNLLLERNFAGRGRLPKVYIGMCSQLT